MSSYYNQGVQVIIGNGQNFPGTPRISLIPFIQNAYDKGLLNFTVLPPGSISLAEIQDISTAKILGRSTAGSGVIEQISIGTGLSLSGGTLSATGGTDTNFANTDLTISSDRYHELNNKQFTFAGDGVNNKIQFSSVYSLGGTNAYFNLWPDQFYIYSNANGSISEGRLSGASLMFNYYDGSQSNTLTLNSDGISLAFMEYGDLRINTNPGTSGQVLTSNGENLPPTWETLSTPLQEIVYSDLIQLINDKQLIPGTFYKLKFSTVHYMPYMTDFTEMYADPFAINIGSVEYLILYAVSDEKISSEVKSLEYPQDIIHYDWNPTNHIDDYCLSEDGSNIITGFQGVITYRKDTLLNIETYYDFREAKFKRHIFAEPDVWDNSTSYAVGDWVTWTENPGYFYVCVKNNTNANPSTSNWSNPIDLGVILTDAVACNYNEFFRKAINSATYTVHPTFILDDFHITISNVYIGNTKTIPSENQINTYENSLKTSRFPNIVFTKDVINVNIKGGAYCGHSTICTKCENNSIGLNFLGNCISSKDVNNLDGTRFSFNNIGDYFTGNLIFSFFGLDDEGNIGGNNIGHGVKHNQFFTPFVYGNNIFTGLDLGYLYTMSPDGWNVFVGGNLFNNNYIEAGYMRRTYFKEVTNSKISALSGIVDTTFKLISDTQVNVSYLSNTLNNLSGVIVTYDPETPTDLYKQKINTLTGTYSLSPL